jgi:hypothetical protein
LGIVAIVGLIAAVIVLHLVTAIIMATSSFIGAVSSASDLGVSMLRLAGFLATKEEKAAREKINAEVKTLKQKIRTGEDQAANITALTDLYNQRNDANIKLAQAAGDHFHQLLQSAGIFIASLLACFTVTAVIGWPLALGVSAYGLADFTVAIIGKKPNLSPLRRFGNAMLSFMLPKATTESVIADLTKERVIPKNSSELQHRSTFSINVPAHQLSDVQPIPAHHLGSSEHDIFERISQNHEDALNLARNESTHHPNVAPSLPVLPSSSSNPLVSGDETEKNTYSKPKPRSPSSTPRNH